MHNIKDIRKNSSQFEKSLKKRFIDINISKILELDESNRKLIQEKENLEKEKKQISKAKNEELFKKSKDISKKIDLIEADQIKIKDNLENILSNIPNIPLPDVPIGKDESSNLEVSKSCLLYTSPSPRDRG